ncbi:hypothetical protein CEXT_693691 [Caerostris extrusa]|uniref:Uncharacterized protein n=1 Tax=Caerostris extrusa TaxID=172846 RepID=A0AAV4XZ17_CAEEX|nr:hypothetical protein CEXT_693691 [Caerostris extrusa]
MYSSLYLKFRYLLPHLQIVSLLPYRCPVIERGHNPDICRCPLLPQGWSLTLLGRVFISVMILITGAFFLACWRPLWKRGEVLNVALLNCFVLV